MLRHLIRSGLRAMNANKLLTAISILGLTIGIAGAILIALIARSTLGYNDFVPDHDRIYLGISVLAGEAMPPSYEQVSSGRAAALISANIDGVEAVARLAEQDNVLIGDGPTARKANIYWADPDIFSVLRLPAISGDPASAFGQPGGIVMTRSAALTSFGQEPRLGARIVLDGRSMELRAILADLSANVSDLDRGIFASDSSPNNPLLATDPHPANSFSLEVRTYMRLSPGTSSQAVEDQLVPLIKGVIPVFMHDAYSMRLMRIDRIALSDAFAPGARQRLEIGTLVAGLVLFIAVANFINLSVALAMKRCREIGVRKANGASQIQIAAQFLMESVLAVFAAAILALALTEWLVSPMNAFLDSNAVFDYLSHPYLIVLPLIGAILLGLISGAYPALIVARLSPNVILSQRASHTGSGTLARQILVAGQFAILICLIIATTVIYQQRRYAMDDALRLDIERMVIVTTPCSKAFADELRKQPSIAGVSCSGNEWLDGHIFAFVERGERRISTQFISVLPSMFSLYGIKPIAGSLQSLPLEGETVPTRIVINEAAVRWFGLGNPQAAIGKTVRVPPDGTGPAIRAGIVAVVPDVSLQSVEKAVGPTFYFDRLPSPGEGGLVSIKLSTASGLDAIDDAWKKTGNTSAIDRRFLSAHIEELYRGLQRNSQLFAVFSFIAIFLACLGLIGLSVATTEQRVKEIGIRKAMGASSRQIVQLLLFQMARPVLLANIIAWPISYWLMSRWLTNFAYHVPFNFWLFPTAALSTLFLALLTTMSHAMRVSVRAPIEALRYE